MNSGTQTDGQRHDEVALARQIRQGDEDAFIRLVGRYQAGLLRLAQSWTHDPWLAEQVVQDTWVVALDRLREFEGRSTIKTWLCHILVNVADNRRRKEGRALPDWSLDDDHAPAVPADRFSPAGHRWDGHWQSPPTAWPETPPESVLSTEMRTLLEQSIDRLPEAQRAVLVLRDIEGLTDEEVCQGLGLTDTHQRVLLHRARSHLRALLERHHRPMRPVAEELL
jgi:RNA polymerase sigma-70 factor (ECF subfamily)